MNKEFKIDNTTGNLTNIIEDINKFNEPIMSSFNNSTYNTNDNYTFQCDAVKGIVDETPLSRIFFSEDNVNYIDSKVRYQIKSIKNYIIDSIKSPELLSIMREIFLENKSISGNTTVDEIKINYEKLNKAVISIATNRTLGGLNEYQSYINNIDSGGRAKSTSYAILDRPEWQGNEQKSFDLSSNII